MCTLLELQVHLSTGAIFLEPHLQTYALLHQFRCLQSGRLVYPGIPSDLTHLMGTLVKLGYYTALPDNKEPDEIVLYTNQ